MGQLSLFLSVGTSFTHEKHLLTSGFARARPSHSVPLLSQRLAYDALLKAFYSEPWYLGTYLWMWRADSSAGGTADDSFTPAGKPAIGVLHHYWT